MLETFNGCMVYCIVTASFSIYVMHSLTGSISAESTLLVDDGTTGDPMPTTVIIASACSFAAVVVIVIGMTVLIIYRKNCVNRLPAAGDD